MFGKTKCFNESHSLKRVGWNCQIVVFELLFIMFQYRCNLNANKLNPVSGKVYMGLANSSFDLAVTQLAQLGGL